MPDFDDEGHYLAPTDRQAYRGARRLVIAGLILVFLLPVTILGIKWMTADARGAISAREQTKANAAFRLAAYNQFFDLCSGVQAQEDRIRLYSADTSPEGLTNLRAVQANRATLVRDYNAKASRSYTEGQFRDNGLPYQLDPNAKETTCKQQ